MRAPTITVPTPPGRGGRGVVRGPLYADGRIYSYHGDALMAADAKTGERVETFGDGGVLPIFSAALSSKYPDVYPPGSTLRR